MRSSRQRVQFGKAERLAAHSAIQTALHEDFAYHVGWERALERIS